MLAGEPDGSAWDGEPADAVGAAAGEAQELGRTVAAPPMDFEEVAEPGMLGWKQGACCGAGERTTMSVAGPVTVAVGAGCAGVAFRNGKVCSLKTTCLEVMTRRVVRSKHR